MLVPSKKTEAMLLKSRLGTVHRAIVERVSILFISDILLNKV